MTAKAETAAGADIPASDPRVAAGFAALQQGRLEDARATFADLMHDPACTVDAHRGLAGVAWQQGRADTAIQLVTSVVQANPDHADARADLALLLLLTGRAADSLEHWDHRVRLVPRDALAWHNYGKALAAAGRLDVAVGAFERAIELEPGLEKTYEVYARTLMEAESEAPAEKVWRRALERFPDSQGPVLGLAELLFKQARLQECLELYRKGVQLFPDSPELHLGFGQLLEDFGDRGGAEGEFRRALELRPLWALPVEALLTLLRKNARDEDIQAARDIMADATRPLADHANAGFGLGKALEARGDYDGAFMAWRRANQARRQQIGPYDREAMSARVDRSIRQFTRAFLNERQGWGSDSRRPVFVLGMPRSGTTLVEQILSAHPDVEGCGELTDLPRVAKALQAHSGSIHRWPEAAGALTAEQVQAGAGDYLQGVLRFHPSSAARLIDKAPSNFMHIGLILLLFPNASIIWCRRDPRDICMSIYSENFGLSQRHATDLSDIGFYFRQHIRLMRHWVEVAGDRIHQCRYENLIADAEGESRRLVQATGLEWDDSCLKFHEGTRPVLTPSRWQVRSPIYKAASGRWQRFADHLKPLTDSLGPELDD